MNLNNPESRNKSEEALVTPEGIRSAGRVVPNKPLRLHEEVRQHVQVITEIMGCRFHAHESVFPSAIFRQYPTVFMSAMQPDLEWLYQGPLPETVETSISTSFCIRSNRNFHNAGQSKRNLKCFEMLSISGRMQEREFFEKTHQLLSSLLNGSDATLLLKLHPTNQEAKQFCFDKNISYQEDAESIFMVPDKTDRVGKKIEWFASKNIKGEVQEWELMDALTITHIDHGARSIDPPLVEAGGSFERILALKENVDNVLLTSAFNVSGLIDKAATKQIELSNEQAFAMQDVARAVIVMSGSGFCLPESSRAATKQQKTFYAACHELALCILERDVSPTLLEVVLENDFNYLKNWQSAKYDFANYSWESLRLSAEIVFRGIQERYDQTIRYITQNQHRFSQPELVKRAANAYFGGTTRLAEIAISNINFN